MLRWCRNTEKRSRHSVKWPLPVPPSGLLLQKLRWKFYGKGVWKEVASCILTISLRLKPLFSTAICNHRNTFQTPPHLFGSSTGQKGQQCYVNGMGVGVYNRREIAGWRLNSFSVIFSHLSEKPTTLSCFSPRIAVVSIMLCCKLRLRDLHNDLWVHKIMCF